MNWDPDSIPGPNDEALINMGGPVTASSLPIEVERLTVETALNLVSSSVEVQLLSSINDLTTSGCCATNIDSGQEKLMIKGNSTFNKRALLLGNNTELQDLSTFLDGMTVRLNSSLSLAGTTEFVGGTHTIETGGRVDIFDTLELQSATLFSANNTKPLWELSGGEIAHTGAGTSSIQDIFNSTSGTLSADSGKLLVSNDYTLMDMELQVTNGGSIEFLPGFGTIFREINAHTITGNGRVDLRGVINEMKPSGEICSTNVMGDGLWIRTALRLGNSELLNTGLISLRGSIEADQGRVRLNSGTMSVDSNSTVSCPVVINSGGTLVNPSQLDSQDEIRIDQGGLFEMHADLVNNSIVPIGPTPNLLVNGLLSLPAGITNQIKISDHLVNLNSTGVIRLNDRRLAIEKGGTLNAGQIILEDTPAGANTEFTFSGDTDTEFVLGNNLQLIGIGDRATCFVGNGFGDQPKVTVEGDAIFNITGDQSTARMRVPQVLGSGFSTIRNLGNMILDRTCEYSVTIENQGELGIQATTTLQSVLNTNASNGNVIQTSTVFLTKEARITNQGNWSFPSSGQIRDTLEAVETYFINQGLFTATAGTTNVELSFINQGQVLADGATMNFSNVTTPLGSGQRAISGKWKSINNGKINVPENGPTIVNGDESEIDGDDDDIDFLKDILGIEDGAKITSGDLNTDDGLDLDNGTLEAKQGGNVTVNGDLRATNDSDVVVNQGATVESTQDINVGSDDPMFPSVTDDLQGVIALAIQGSSPPSVIATNINIHANLTPDRDSICLMNTSGTLTIHPTGNLRINAQSDGVSSAINHTGDLDILGDIQITAIDGYTPQLGNAFTIATVSGSIGSLPTEAAGDAGSGLVYAVCTNGTDVIVTVVVDCPSDLNNDGELNFFDVSAFLVAFNAMDPIADFNDDDLFNFFDVSAFLTSFNEGCALS